jgi:hypothetical protein
MTKRNAYAKVCIRIAVILFVCALAGGIFAKYFHQENAQGSVRAKEFYFTSDLLDEKSKGKTYTYAPGTTALTFELRNLEDDLRYAETDVFYRISIEAKNDVKTSITHGDSSENAKTTGKLTGGKSDTASVTLENLQAGTYTVTVLGRSSEEEGSGYYQTLTAVFNIPDDTPVVYK